MHQAYFCKQRLSVLSLCIHQGWHALVKLIRQIKSKGRPGQHIEIWHLGQHYLFYKANLNCVQVKKVVSGVDVGTEMSGWHYRSVNVNIKISAVRYMYRLIKKKL